MSTEFLAALTLLAVAALSAGFIGSRYDRDPWKARHGLLFMALMGSRALATAAHPETEVIAVPGFSDILSHLCLQLATMTFLILTLASLWKGLRSSPIQGLFWSAGLLLGLWPLILGFEHPLPLYTRALILVVALIIFGRLAREKRSGAGWMLLGVLFFQAGLALPFAESTLLLEVGQRASGVLLLDAMGTLMVWIALRKQLKVVHA